MLVVGQQLGQRVEPDGQRLVEQVAAVEVQQVEEERAEQHAGVRRITAEPAHRVLERPRPAVVVQGQGLAVEDDGLARQRPHPLDELGHAVGHLPQRAGPHPDVVAVPVHLDARAVELELHGHLGAEGGERGVQRRAGAGEHRAHRPADLQPHGVQRLDPAGQRRGRRLRQPAGEHERPADGGGGDVGRGGDGLQHDALQGALAELAGEQADEELLLVGGRGRQQRGRGARRGAPRSRRRRSRRARSASASTAATVRDGASAGSPGHPRQGAPADAEPALPRLAGQPAGDRLDLAGVRPPQQVGDRGGLRGAGPGGSDRGGGGDDVGEQHARHGGSTSRGAATDLLDWWLSSEQSGGRPCTSASTASSRR